MKTAGTPSPNLLGNPLGGLSYRKKRVRKTTVASFVVHMTLTERENFWQQHYRDNRLAENGQSLPCLDLSNQHVHAQTLSLALQAAGPGYERQCLDVGCGWGQLARCLHALGGNVVGIDIVEDTIAELRQSYPQIQWFVGSFLDRSILEPLGYFDVILAIEVLQYVELADALNILWSRLNSGGRIVGVVPHAGCPLVQRTTSRFEGKYRGVEAQTLSTILNQLQSQKTWAVQGFVFRKDQQLLPYETTPWSNTWNWSVVPNRLLFVAQKR